MSNEPIETTIVTPEPSQAVAVRQNSDIEVSQTKGGPVTAAQAKVEAIATLTMAAYQKAATLELTPEESAALQADFPDEAFQPGAAGKEHLIYIEHAHLRDRFNAVFGMGKWAIVPRNRWAEPFNTQKGDEGSRVYVEAMLVVRGCFVGEAVGAMEYYPHNASQNYGDAVEGAKTAAFRRCAKEFGVGLQAWKKEFCDGWWARKRGGRDFSRKPAVHPHKPESKPPWVCASCGQTNSHWANECGRCEKPKDQLKPATPKFATEKTREWFIKEIVDARDHATGFLIDLGWIMPNETLELMPLRWVPISKAQLESFKQHMGTWIQEGRAEKPYDANPEAPITDERKPKAAASSDESWRTFPMPFGKHAGTALEDLEKNYLFGLWANYTVETEYKGKPKKPETIAKDQEFRSMLDLAGAHYQFTKKD